jgi:rhodanese-related sulfurtransferase
MRRLSIVVAGVLFSAPLFAGEVAWIDQDTLLGRLARKDAELVVLDVRTPEEFAAGHVPGALNVAHDQVEARLPELAAYKSKDVVVYCRSGRRSDIALKVLEANGFERLWHLEGDILAWQAQNRPMETSAAAPKPDAKPDPGPQ